MVVGRNMFPKTVQNSCFDGGPLHSLHHLKLAFSKNKVTSQGASGLVSCRWNCQWSPFAGSWCCSQWWHLARKHQPNEAVYPPMVASNISKNPLFSLVKKHVETFDVFQHVETSDLINWLMECWPKIGVKIPMLLPRSPNTASIVLLEVGHRMDAALLRPSDLQWCPCYGQIMIQLLPII